jgi:hypothetical protein
MTFIDNQSMSVCSAIDSRKAGALAGQYSTVQYSHRSVLRAAGVTHRFWRRGLLCPRSWACGVRVGWLWCWWVFVCGGAARVLDGGGVALCVYVWEWCWGLAGLETLCAGVLLGGGMQM